MLHYAGMDELIGMPDIGSLYLGWVIAGNFQGSEEHGVKAGCSGTVTFQGELMGELCETVSHDVTLSFLFSLFLLEADMLRTLSLSQPAPGLPTHVWAQLCRAAFRGGMGGWQLQLHVESAFWLPSKARKGNAEVLGNWVLIHQLSQVVPGHKSQHKTKTLTNELTTL